MKMIRILSVLGISTFISMSHASDFYVGTDLSYMNVDIADETAKPYLLNIKAGYMVQPQIALEIQHGSGVEDDKLFERLVDVDSSSGVYVRLMSGNVNDISADILIGYASTKITMTGEGSVITETYSDAAYGIGLNQYYPELPNLVLRMEFKALYNTDDLRINVFNIGANYSY